MTWHDIKGSRQARGYGRQWDKVRRLVLDRDADLCQCQHCKTDGQVRVANEVDHIVPKARAIALGWTRDRMDDPANLQAINSECHKRKTIEENGGAPRQRVTIGLDGFPVR